MVSLQIPSLTRPLALVGFMGCGKSTVGKALAQALHAPFVDLDDEIALMAKAPIPQIFATLGEVGFRDYEYNAVRLLPTVQVVPAAPGRHAMASVVTPYRPRARALAAPAGEQALDRLRVLTDAAGGSTRGETVVLAPREAAARIVQALHDWGYLDHPGRA